MPLPLLGGFGVSVEDDVKATYQEDGLGPLPGVI